MNHKVRVSIFDDDQTFLSAISLGLQNEYEVKTYTCPSVGIDELPWADVLVCDFKMTTLNGNEVLELVKVKQPNLPVIIVTAYATKEMAIQAANLHVEHILEKPFELNLLRDAITKSSSKIRNKISTVFNEIILCSTKLTATIKGITHKLTLTEYRILDYFLKNKGVRTHRSEIIKHVWESEQLSNNVLDIHLGNLRKKIPELDKRLTVVRGLGYIYE